ncbi:MAG: helix-turn-helix transcriptional regulator [Methyloprofundus sp.]|nr:helix-turn-helix transcriptional regulator [Methyloprofundus sp.]
MDFQELSKALSDLRRSQNISQKTMAAHIDISRATINALETGRAGDVGVRKIMKIIDYLGFELCIREKSPFPTFEELRDE